jgi:hypothetical protein
LPALETSKFSILKFIRSEGKNNEVNMREQYKRLVSIRGKLVYFANVCSKEELLVSSEIGWITKDRFILTLND